MPHVTEHMHTLCQSGKKSLEKQVIIANLSEAVLLKAKRNYTRTMH